MKQGNAIEVNNITKKFKVYYDKGRQLKEKLLFKNRNRYEERQVLNGISFEVKKGEAIGLIGKNGCGKSTTLKLLTKIIYPNSGSIEMAGRVSSLIELGAGFHQDMTGRENIYTNAAIFGLGKKEIDEKIDDIIEFSELGEFIDNPVRTYSSGMYMRLAFSVAINVEADILLIDEILAVGDAAFQAKCFNRLREIKAAGTTIVIVSHSLGQIEQICDRAIWIKDGNIELEGEPRGVIQLYMSWIMDDSHKKQNSTKTDKEKDNEINNKKIEKDNALAGAKKTEKAETKEEKVEKHEYTPQEIVNLRKSGKYAEIGNRDIIITNYELLSPDSEKRKQRFCVGEDILCRIFYKRMNNKIKEAMCSLAIYRADGLLCYTTNSLMDTGKNFAMENEGVLEFLIKACPLLQGEYRMDIGLNMDYGPTYHGILNACNFEMYNTTTDYGICRPDITWATEQEVSEQSYDSSKLNMKNYETELKIATSLNVNEGNCEELNELLEKEYDLIVVENVFRTLEEKKQIIKQVLENTKWLLVCDSDKFNFERKIYDSVLLKDENVNNSLIKITTKNKKIILDILSDIKDKQENKWLLDSFKEGMISIRLGKVVENEGKKMLNVSLYNSTDSIINLLDEGIYISYRIKKNEELFEGPWINLQKKLYCKDNKYMIPVEDTGMLCVSVLKNGEFWLADVLPELCKNIEVL